MIKKILRVVLGKKKKEEIKYIGKYHCIVPPPPLPVCRVYTQKGESGYIPKWDLDKKVNRLKKTIKDKDKLYEMVEHLIWTYEVEKKVGGEFTVGCCIEQGKISLGGGFNFVNNFPNVSKKVKQQLKKYGF
jgi:hypothetical protein